MMDGVYERITINYGQFNGRPVRIFKQDKSSSASMFLDTDDPNDLVYDYTKYYRLYEAFDIKEGDGMYLPEEDRVKIW